MYRERAQLAVYVHLVWGTWDRLPLLSGEFAQDLYRAIGAECVAMGAELIAVGGVEDHVHVLASLPATIAVADLVKRLKGSSAHLATHRLILGGFFKWQAGYGAVSVSPRHLAQVSSYIANQREHHADSSLIANLEIGATGRS
jgi:REP element-mobilizing transposase RayT